MPWSPIFRPKTDGGLSCARGHASIIAPGPAGRPLPDLAALADNRRTWHQPSQQRAARIMKTKRRLLRWPKAALVLAGMAVDRADPLGSGGDQTVALRPKWDNAEGADVFFPDARQALVGPRPTASAVAGAGSSGSAEAGAAGSGGAGAVCLVAFDFFRQPGTEVKSIVRQLGETLTQSEQLYRRRISGCPAAVQRPGSNVCDHRRLRLGRTLEASRRHPFGRSSAGLVSTAKSAPTCLIARPSNGKKISKS